MNIYTEPSVVAFAGTRLIASGTLAEAALAATSVIDSGSDEAVLIFDAATSEQLEVDLRGSASDVLDRLPAVRPRDAAAPPEQAATGCAVANCGVLPAGDGAAAPAPRSPGRPKLGVVAREVTLLPRHWEWLAAQPGSASVALRKLVEAARKAGVDDDRSRLARDATYRFAATMAGNEPGFEEATRALYAGDRARFEELVGGWPADVRDHALRVSAPGFSA